jgi:putative glutamine amidotransferase
MRKIIAKKMPLLGICWGEQLLNILLGGTLYQDIPAEIGTEIAHKSKQPHEIQVDKESLLYKIVGKERYKVNTSHHQSVKKPGANLIVSAVAADGVIEAIEHTGQPFCIGVEWHPEYLDSEQDKKLMRAFIEAANTYNAKD